MLLIFNQKEVFQDIVSGLQSYLEETNLPVRVVNNIPTRTSVNDLYICFGLNDYQGPIPSRYIVYQLEQTADASGPGRHWFSDTYLRRLRRAKQIWDYSIKNIQNLKKQYGIEGVKYVPLRYMQVLDNNQQQQTTEADKDIDVLFFGSKNPRRLKIFNDLTQIGLKVDFSWYNLWGKELLDKISRAKIVLNIHFYDQPILETTRLSYLVGNSAFVISEPSIDPILDKEYNEYVHFTSYDRIVEDCLKFLVAKDQRAELVSKLDKYKEFPFGRGIDTTLLQYYASKIEPDTSDTEPDNDKILKTDEDGLPKIELKYVEADMETTAEGDAILKLPRIDFNDLPFVSIVTLTYNRSEMFEIAVRNFQRFIYPEGKMEWIIIDDSNSHHQAINKRLVANIPMVKYVPLEKRLSISEKRNMSVQEANYDIIVHMDDDDYYPPESVLARVKLLLKYQDRSVGCVGCREIGVYNLIENYSYLNAVKFPSEASLAYTREFWEENPFPAKDVPEGEGIPFIYQRTEQVLMMPHIFNLIAITHHKNVTGKLRTADLDPDQKYTNFFNLWDINTQLFFLEILSKIRKEQRRIEEKNN